MFPAINRPFFGAFFFPLPPSESRSSKICHQEEREAPDPPVEGAASGGDAK